MSMMDFSPRPTGDLPIVESSREDREFAALGEMLGYEFLSDMDDEIGEPTQKIPRVVNELRPITPAQRFARKLADVSLVIRSRRGQL